MKSDSAKARTGNSVGGVTGSTAGSQTWAVAEMANKNVIKNTLIMTRKIRESSNGGNPSNQSCRASVEFTSKRALNRPFRTSKPLKMSDRS